MADRQSKSGPAVRLRTGDGRQLDIRGGPRLEQAAMAWSYIARHRIRWQRSNAARDDLAQRCFDQLAELGVDGDALAAMARSRLVEVSVPCRRDDANRAGRVMPWEHVISAAVRVVSDASVVVVRHVDGGRRAPAAARARRAAVVLGAVDALQGCYTFDTERTLAGRTLATSTVHVDDPTPAELRRKIAAMSPDTIHVGGVDVQQGLEYFEVAGADPPPDGMFLTGEDGRPVVVPALDLARTLTAGKSRKPGLVVFNLYHSAAHMAPLTVAEGAGAALGFQDTFDDLRAELFIGEFYRAWQASGGDPLVSFYVAWTALRDTPAPIAGSGVVLWSSRSLVEPGMKALERRADAIRRRLTGKRSKGSTFPSSKEAADALSVTVRPLERLNYALLHNRQPLFDWFELRNLDEQRSLSGVRIEVELFAGPERLPFSTTLQVEDAPVPVEDKIFIPLTSTLVRSLTESIRAGLHVRVSVGDHVGVHETSYRVTLLPTDEWVDDDENRQWLPSFVFPQDPGVGQIVEAARRYLTFLADSPSAGFDGYQSVDPEAEDPTAGVDWQVEAIWAALVHAFSLGYINPPPSYTEQSQRLRFPSRVLGGKEGTCIDLALLLASCLEYVGIFPVIFLLEGHAFPGYWRSEESWDEFINMRGVERLGVKALARLTATSGPVDQRYPWVFPAPFHAEVMKQIEQGNLVPLETVWITTHSKFDEARDTGWENLLKASEFHSLIDITMARECDVTPLPVEKEPA